MYKNILIGIIIYLIITGICTGCCPFIDKETEVSPVEKSKETSLPEQGIAEPFNEDVWSLTGQIVYLQNLGRNKRNIILKDLDNSNEAILYEGFIGIPSWSTDGKILFFSCGELSSPEICLIDFSNPDTDAFIFAGEKPTIQYIEGLNDLQVDCTYYDSAKLSDDNQKIAFICLKDIPILDFTNNSSGQSNICTGRFIYSSQKSSIQDISCVSDSLLGSVFYAYYLNWTRDNYLFVTFDIGDEGIIKNQAVEKETNRYYSIRSHDQMMEVYRSDAGLELIDLKNGEYEIIKIDGEESENNFLKPSYFSQIAISGDNKYIFFAGGPWSESFSSSDEIGIYAVQIKTKKIQLITTPGINAHSPAYRSSP